MNCHLSLAVPSSSHVRWSSYAMRRPSGENTTLPILPRVDSRRSGAVQSLEGLLRVALSSCRRSSDAHAERSPSGDRLADAGGLMSASAGSAQLGAA
jgi:hypothetical protein